MIIKLDMRIRLTPITWFVILTIIAIGLALGLTPDPEAVKQLHTSALDYRLAVAALLIPYVIIWYASFYAYSKLREYSRPLKSTKDGAAFNKITLGMGVLAFSLVVPTIISLILDSIAVHHPSFKSASIIIDNYLALYPPLLAFILFCSGARSLLLTIKGGFTRFDIRWHAPWFLLLCVVFSHLTIENQYHSHPYHLSLWLLIVTLIVPYLYAWMLGLLSAFELHWYARTVKGLLYQQAVRRFARGIATVIFGSIAIQFVNNTLAHRIDNSLGMVLLVDYLLIAVLAVGLVLMALGTKKLKLIEEL
jgi:hypothetical protein